LLCQPIKDYDFDLIIFLNADLWLSIPDYNSSEKNFYFLYEAFTKHNCQNFIVQSFNPSHHSIRQSCKLDKDWFYDIENEFRKVNDYPPFKDICIILYKNEIEEKLFNKVDKLYKELLYLKEKYQIKDIEIYSTPPLIYKIFWKYRYNIILKWSGIRNFMDIVYTKLKLNQNWFKINRQAESIV
jgi:primosomal protein N'